jgi:ADP-heptose:LPS heptosyltransferase
VSPSAVTVILLVNAKQKDSHRNSPGQAKNLIQLYPAKSGGLVPCFLQVGSAEHDHPTLDGVVNLVGRTDTRQLICLACHAQGGLGPITFLQHLCAAFEKPYVALLGGREPVSWTQYPLQTTLHTLGKLPCCRTHACWRSRVVALNDGAEQDRSLCEAPVLTMSRPVGKCMAIIRPEEVIRAIEACYDGGAMSYGGNPQARPPMLTGETAELPPNYSAAAN